MAKVDDTETATRFGKVRKFDPKFQGPVKNRSCTDIFCAFLFLGFLAGWGYIAYYAFQNGVLERIIHPTDSQAQICGYEHALDKPYLFYFDLTKCVGPQVLVAGCTLTKSICVSYCPNTTFFMAEVVTSLTTIDTSRLICIPEVDKSKLKTLPDVEEVVLSGLCASYYFPSGPVGGRCLPGFTEGPDGRTQTLFSNINTSVPVSGKTISFSDVINGSTWINIFIQTEQTFDRIAADYSSSWKTIIAGIIASAILSLIWIIIIRWVAGPILWLSILAAIAGLCYGVYNCYQEYTTLSTYLGTNASLVTSNEEFNWKDLNCFATNPTFWFVIGIITLAVLVILCLIVLFLRNRIRTAIALIRVSSRAIWHMKSTLFFPLFPLGCQLICLAVNGACLVWLTATGACQGVVTGSNDTLEGLRDNDSCDPNDFSVKYPNATGTCKFIQFYKEPYVVFFQIYNAFGFLWGIAFCTALGYMVLSGSFASYYWAWSKPKDVPLFPILASLYRAVRFHLGSLAFGSILVAIVQIVQYVLLYVERKLKRGDNEVTRFLIKMCVCCLLCLEKCIKFINRHAYIMIAIFGRNFCVSAKDAFMLLVRNAMRVVVVDSIVAFFLFFGKVLIMASLGTFYYFFYTFGIPGLEQYGPKLNYIYVPLVTLIVASFVISSVFFSVYTMAIDTMFLCFLEDLERNDGSVDKPYFMSKSLMKIYPKRTNPHHR